MTTHRAYILLFDKVDRNGNLIPSTAKINVNLLPTVQCGIDDIGVWVVMNERSSSYIRTRNRMGMVYKK